MSWDRFHALYQRILSYPRSDVAVELLLIGLVVWAILRFVSGYCPGPAPKHRTARAKATATPAPGVPLPPPDPADMPAPQLGSRHRAAVGLTKECDAMVVVVSEETGQIRIAERGRLSDPIAPGELRDEILRRLRLEPPAAEPQTAEEAAQTRILSTPSENPEHTDQEDAA